MRIAAPRGRGGSFEPLPLPKHARRFTAFGGGIAALYARGLTVREIQGYLAGAHGTGAGHDLISTVTGGVLTEVAAWQGRPLEPVYPAVFFDALRVKVREDAVARGKAVYLALGARRGGTREIPGPWIGTAGGAKFWMKVFNGLKTRGVSGILIAATGGLTGMPVALEAVFPRTTLRTCAVHLIRGSLDHASWKDRKPLANALRPVYAAASAGAAEAALDAFADGEWGRRMGAEVPHGGCRVAAGLGAGDPVLRVPARDTARDPHGQRDREREFPVTQDHQDARSFPGRRRGGQADMVSTPQHHRRLE